jgi:hypothetical protein
MPRGKKAGGVNKMEAARQVIAKHGKDTMPVEIVKFAKAEHGVDLSPDVASNYKSAVLRELGRGGKRKVKRGRKPGRKPAAAPAAAAPRTGGDGISLEDIAAVKKLCDTLGAEKVQQLAQVLAK